MSSEDRLKDILKNTLDEYMETASDLRSRIPSMVLIYPLDQHYQRSGFIGQKWMLKLCCMAPGEEHTLEGGGEAKEGETNPALGWYRLDDLGEYTGPIIRWMKGKEKILKTISLRLGNFLEWVHKDEVTSFIRESGNKVKDISLPDGSLPKGGGKDLPVSSEMITLAGLDEHDYRKLEGQGLIFLQQVFKRNQPCGNLHLLVHESRMLWLCQSHRDKLRSGRVAAAIKTDITRLRDACWRVTQAFRAVALDRPVIVPRPGLRMQLDAFLSTRTRYCFVIGPSGVGKSTALALEAGRLQQQGWTVLSLRGKDFSLESAAAQIGQHYPTGCGGLGWHQIIRLLTEEQAEPKGRFILMIDAVDIAESSVITREMELLHHSIVTMPPESLKVVITCRDVVWDEFRIKMLPDFIEDTSERARESANSYMTVRLGDFSPDELDAALKEVGMDELIVLRPHGEWIDPHVASLRVLLLHPQNFGYYAELRSSGSTAEAADWTWSDLIERYLEKMLRRVERNVCCTADELRRMLRRVAAAGWRQLSPDLSLAVESLKSEVPELFLQGDAASPFGEFVRNGLLVEVDRTVGFRFTDTGGWLLSLELQSQFEASPAAERAVLLDQWLSDAGDYHPVFDAVLAWIDRLSVRPDDPQLLDLLQRIIDSGREGYIFKLLRPAVVRSLFLLLIRDEEEKQSLYFDAGNALRPSPEALREIRWYLRDPDARARRLAAQLAGRHRDEQAVPDLLNLLGDEDFHTRQAAYHAVERIGKAALPALLSRIRDETQTDKTRAACLHALRNTGHLNDEISDLIGQALKSNDEGVLVAAVLAAALYRDKRQRQSVLPFLQHENHHLVQCAAKYFEEVPTPEAFVQLEQAARRHFAAGDENIESFPVFRQLAVTLVRTDRDAALPLVLEFVREGIAGKKTFPIHIIIERAEKFGLPEVFRPVIRELTRQAGPGNAPDQSFDHLRRLGEIWRPEQLDALAETAKELSAGGNDLSRLLTGQVAQHIEQHDMYPMADRLNRVKDLRLLAKCRADNLIPALCELLAVTPDLSTRELCEWLWVAADPQAEGPLLAKLPDPSGKRHWYSTYAVLRALGTCGGRRAKEEILRHLCGGGEIALHFHQEVLHPLLYRRELLPAELGTLALDTQRPGPARMCSLLALAEWDAPAYREVIQQVAADPADAKLQAQAVRLLFLAKDASIIPYLRRMLRDRNCHPAVKEQAATVLGWLDATEALAEIERVCGNNPAGGLISTLARFKSESSLPIILAGVKEKGWGMLREYVEALGAFAHLPRGRAAIQGLFEEWAGGREDYLNLQSHLIEGLASHQPSFLLQEIIDPWDKKHLHARGRLTLAVEARRLIIRQSVELPALLPVMTRLISDEDLAVRETALQGLVFATQDFCRSLFETMWSAPNADECTRAAAVATLGYWQSDEWQPDRLRYDPDLLVRQAADIALKGKTRRSALGKLVDRFQSIHGNERLAAWLCLTERGDWATAKQCLTVCQRGTIRYAFEEELFRKVADNDKRIIEKQKHDRQFFGDSRGAVTFD